MKDLSGNRYDMLIVLRFSHRNGTSHRYRYFWECQCDCGKIVIRRADSLTGKGVKSCGCYRDMKLAQNNFKIKNPMKSHGMSKTRLYKIYNKMKERCYNTNYPEFHLYGGRGIEMCDEWEESFEPFKEWALNNGYAKDLSIDRINFNGNYEPSNCRWADIYEQANNKRDNIVLTYNGMTKTLPEWARYLDLPYSTLANRYRRKKPIAEILYPKKLR